MLRTLVPPIVLIVALVTGSGRALAFPVDNRSGPPSTALPASIVVHPRLEAVVAKLLAASATFRDQYERIATARVRVVVQPVQGRLIASQDARSTISRTTSGTLLATVEVPSPLREVEYAELLAHEFEHILEQIEGVDLRDLAERRSEGVSRLADGAYETERARRAGRTVATEIETDPAEH